MSMADIKVCHIAMVAGQDNKRRSVGFLICADEKVNAFSVYNELPSSQNLKTSFDYWLMNKPNIKRFHGWDKSSFGGKSVHCYVFKVEQRRFYGFLCNPNVKDPRYQLCVLVLHDNKKQHETDETDLRRVEEFRSHPVVRSTITEMFRGDNCNG